MPPPGCVSLGLTTWNIERFDGAGEKDTTFPTRNAEQLAWLARILLDTNSGIIVLEEIAETSEFSPVAPLLQLVEELDRQEAARSGKPGGDGSWQGFIGSSPGFPSKVALVWNRDEVEVEALGELAELRVGYTDDGVRVPADALRFPRVPVAGRFRLKRAPWFDLTVVGVHLKAMNGGFEDELDVEDRRRLGELSDLFGDWVLQTGAVGPLADPDLAVLGDFNEQASNLVRLMEEHASDPRLRNLLFLYPDAVPASGPGFFFADAAALGPDDYSFQGNAEKGQPGRDGPYPEDTVWPSSGYVIDHVLLSSALARYWDGSASIEYFDKELPLHDLVRMSDHRPVTVRLVVPLRDPADQVRAASPSASVE